MFIYFNQEGKATTIIPHGENLRQGSYFNLTLCFEENSFNPDDKIIGVELLLPGATERTVPTIATEIGYPDVKVFKKAIGAEVTYDLVDGKKYLMYKYTFTPEFATYKAGDLQIFVSLSSITEEGFEIDKQYLSAVTAHIEKVFGNANIDKEIDITNYENLMAQIRKLMDSKIDKNDYVIEKIEFDGRNFIITTQNKVQLEDGTETNVLTFPVFIDDAVAIDEIEIDETVIKNSKNLVTSGAVYKALVEQGGISITADYAYRLRKADSEYGISVGSNEKPVYFVGGIPYECKSVRANYASTAGMATSAQALALIDSVGDDAHPVYFDNQGKPVASRYKIGTAEKIGESDVGSSSRPIYLKNGTPEACSAVAAYSAQCLKGATGFMAAGDTHTPVYFNTLGVPSPCLESYANALSTKDEDDNTQLINAGDENQPVYFKDGIPVACNQNVGSVNQPVYFKDGIPTACAVLNAGSSSIPVYFENGVVKACSISTGLYKHSYRIVIKLGGVTYTFYTNVITPDPNPDFNSASGAIAALSKGILEQVRYEVDEYPNYKYSAINQLVLNDRITFTTILAASTNISEDIVLMLSSINQAQSVTVEKYNTVQIA